MITMLDYSLQCLANKFYSERELINSLKNYFFNVINVDKKIEDTIAKLYTLEILNDQRMAVFYADQYKYKGNEYISNKLKQKGFDELTIKIALTKLADEYYRALEVIKMKAESAGNKISFLQPEELLRFLTGRGFSEKKSKAAIEDFINSNK